MLLAVDIGGTHTDAALVRIRTGKSKAGQFPDAEIVNTAKVRTHSDDLVGSITEALIKVLEILPADKKYYASMIQRLTVSTTLVTNALSQGQLENTALILVPGPGIKVQSVVAEQENCFVLSGAVDHQGDITSALSEAEVQALSEKLGVDGACVPKVCAVVSKFSPRNPALEKKILAALPSMDFVCCGHELSGGLNFPRRAATAFYNAALWRVNRKFLLALQKSVIKLGIEACKVRILKADGGTFTLDSALARPVEIASSGPAASIMGALALSSEQNAEGAGRQWLAIDIGGSTTDIGIISGISPLTEKYGLRLSGRATLVPGLLSRSLPLGGDSSFYFQSGNIYFEKQRKGACFAAGGPVATLTDALNVLGLSSFGNVKLSCRIFENLAVEYKVSGQQELAALVIESAVEEVAQAIVRLLDEANAGPVYTIEQLLAGEKVKPLSAVLLGGPAAALSASLERRLRIPVFTGAYAEVANAVGAALARPTAELDFFADSELGVAKAPVAGFEISIPRGYKLADAEQEARAILLNTFESDKLEMNLAAPEIDVVEAESFTKVGDYGVAGRICRVRCRIRPGLLAVPIVPK